MRSGQQQGHPLIPQGVYYRDFVDFIWYLMFMQHAGHNLLELIFSVGWCMWHNRNKARLGSTRLGPTRQTSQEIIHKARSIIEEFQLAYLTRPRFKKHAEDQWVPPLHPWYKVNSDAAVFSHLKTVGIGVIIRDHEGSVITTLSKHLPLPLGPLEAEAKAMDEAVLFAWDVGIRDAIFETDSSVVSDALSGSITPPVSIVDIIVGALHRLQDFRHTQLQHVRRQANKPAHSLAQHAKDVTDFIDSFVFHDAVYLSPSH